MEDTDCLNVTMSWVSSQNFPIPIFDTVGWYNEPEFIARNVPEGVMVAECEDGAE